jgi:hypothetical protein
VISNGVWDSARKGGGGERVFRSADVPVRIFLRLGQSKIAAVTTDVDVHRR